MASVLEMLTGFFSLIRNGKGEGIIPFLSPEVKVDDPLLGRFQGEESFRDFIHRERNWLAVYEAGIEPFRAVSCPEGIALEYTFTMEEDGRNIELPVAMIVDLEGQTITSIRIYYSTWPVYGNHRVRGPLLPEIPGLELPEPVKSYLEAIAGTEVERVIEIFDDEGYVREPAGNAYRHSGKRELREFYDLAISGGGIPLKHCGVLNDGKTTVVEYFFSRWNEKIFPEQSGVAFYDITGPGKISAVRIYDDADPQF